MQHGHAMIKTICVLALGALVVGCHLDKLLSGSGGGAGPTSHAPPAGLRFTTQPPQSASVSQLIRVDVSVVDSAGTPVAGAETTMVVVALETPPGGVTLGGTKSAHPVRGVASFPDLSVSQAGTYRLVASALGFQARSDPFEIKAPPPTTGDLTVTTNTSGSDLDPDGYTVTLDGSTSQSIGSNDANGVTFPSLPAGPHSVALSGVASNCSVSGGTSHGVTITAGQANSTAFSVTCTPIPPTTGSLTVTTSTSGADLDPDGYTVTVDAGNSQSIGPNNSTGVTFNNLSAGNHPVVLSGVAPNCSVNGGTSRTVAVSAGGNASTAFSVTCTPIPPTTGSLTVTTSTSGSDLDPDGYTVTVEGAGSQPIPTNSGGSGVTFSGLAAGSHSVALSGVASNCSVSGGTSHTVTVIAGQTISHAFTVTCAAIPPTTGDLAVSTTTGGSDLDPDGYTVTVDGDSRPIGTSGGVTFSALSAGSHTVALTGLASNCAVSGQNPRSANVPAGGVGHADFAISCTALPPPQNHPPSVTAGGDETVLVGALYSLGGASFSDADHDGPWTVTIDWGDGGSNTFTMPNEGSISASHSYGDLLLAHHTVTITVEDAHGARATASKSVTVVLL